MQNLNKLAIFDLDGTIIDSLPDIIDCVNETLEKFGHAKREYADIRKFIGNGARVLVEKSIGEALSEEELLKRLNYYNNLYTNSGSPKTKVYDGMKEIISKLKERGYYTAVITNKPQMTTDNVMENYFSDISFDAVIGQKEGVKRKPDPTSTLYLLDKFNVPKENAFFIGDGETDCLTAKNAGVKSISVLWGYRDRKDLEEASANLFIDNPKALLDLMI